MSRVQTSADLIADLRSDLTSWEAAEQLWTIGPSPVRKRWFRERTRPPTPTKPSSQGSASKIAGCEYSGYGP
jgi:hypothetical protein